MPDSPDQWDEPSFVAGYQACMRDLNGSMSMERAQVMWADPEVAARSALSDPAWLDRQSSAWHAAPVSPCVPASPRKTQPGIIYVFWHPGSERYKIGWTSRRVEARKAAIEKAAGCRLELVGTLVGTMDDEKTVHARFDAARLQGEWFAATPLVREWVQSLAA